MAKSLALSIAARSELGLVRKINEDSGLIGKQILAIADGMGGHVAGEIASSIAIKALEPLDSKISLASPIDDDTLTDFLLHTVAGVDDQIGAMIDEDPRLEGMGTTLTALIFDSDRIAIVHVGDSRCYRIRDGRTDQLTRDHTLVQELVDQGRITDKEALKHPQRSLLTQALMGHHDITPDIAIYDAKSGDRFLLCSDGLSSVVAPSNLREILATGTVTESLDELLNAALKRGAPDNVSAIVVDLVELDDSDKSKENADIMMASGTKAIGAAMRQE
ncbi:MAG TPA: protein phosphatase 2C domain-containing protein [Candidatus Nanopelagicaceae bacterium]|nr:protein phosphatase 2C domain-containing protein [Candidatus Nanopelagicaceae bacterium]